MFSLQYVSNYLRFDNMICKICGNNDKDNIHTIKEMMYGMEDIFHYVECSNCGCLQLVDIPSDMSKYYPPDYYSFKNIKSNYLMNILTRKRDDYAVFKKGFLGRIIYHYYPSFFLHELRMVKVKPNHKVLDVGCGGGYTLKSLKNIKFTDLTGIDPFIVEDVAEENLQILKRNINDLPDIPKFDLIMFTHSFEHVEDPLKTLRKVNRLLSDNGVCMISMPVKTEYIWNKYGTDWIQIDAPRHFFIHTLESFRILTEKADMNVEKILFNSFDLQFWGSEQYKKGIPLMSERSYYVNPKKSIFTQNEIKKFKNKSNELNKINQGDQALFILRGL